LFGLLPEDRSVKKIQNRHTDHRTLMYISQRWMNIATSMRECGIR
jgi:hypothetical protein